MTKRFIKRILAAMLCAVTVVSAMPSTVYADDFDYSHFATAGDHPETFNVKPPENEGAAQNEYPWARFSDTDVQMPTNTNSLSATSDKTLYDNIEIQEETDSSAESESKAGNIYSVPAVYVTVLEFENNSNIDSEIAKYLSSHVNQTSLTSALKFVSTGSIQQNGGTYIFDNSRFPSQVTAAGGYIIEDQFKDDDAIARSFLAAHIYNNGTDAVTVGMRDRANSDYYYELADAIYNSKSIKTEDKTKAGFSNDVIDRILAIAEGGTDKYEKIPVILMYSGFFEYHTKSISTPSVFKTYTDIWGTTPNMRGYDIGIDGKVTGLAESYVNFDQATANQAYGSASAIAFGVNQASKWAIQFYKGASGNYDVDNLASLNTVTYNGKAYIGRTYLRNGSTLTSKGANTTLYYSTNAVSGLKKNNTDGTVTVYGGSSVKDFSATYAGGYFEIHIQEAANSAKTSNRSSWDLEIEMSAGYANGDPNCKYADGRSKAVLTVLAKNVQLKNLTDGSITSLVRTPTVTGSNSNYTIKVSLTQAEMDKLLAGTSCIRIYGEPANGTSLGSYGVIYAPVQFKLTAPNTHLGNGYTYTMQPVSPSGAGSYKTGLASDGKTPISYNYMWWRRSDTTEKAPTYSDNAVTDGGTDALTVSSADSSSEHIQSYSSTNKTNSIGTPMSISTRSIESDGILNLLPTADSIDDGVLNLTPSTNNDSQISTYADGGIMAIAAAGASSLPFNDVFVGGEAYAEIVGNSVGYIPTNDRYTAKYDLGWAMDWNVLAGIPSTENLSVAAGGSQYAVSAAGFVWTERGINRPVNIKATVTHGWGSDLIATPCTIDYNGHGPTCGNTHSCSKSGDDGECGWTCPHAGCGYVCTNSGPGWETKEDGSTVPKTSGSSHDCSGKLWWDCSNNSANASGTMVRTSWGSNGQHDNQGWNGWVNGYCSICGAGYSDSCNSGLIDNGYTVGVGNHCCGHTNLYHTETETASLTINEYISEASWREITSTKVWALGYSQIEEVDEQLISSMYDGYSSSNADVIGMVWRGALGIVDGMNNGPNYEKAGHIWFTQFKDAHYTQGGAWRSSGTNSKYYFGKCDVSLDLVCDGNWASAGASGYDRIGESRNTIYPGNIHNRGQVEHHYDDYTWGIGGARPPETWRSVNVPTGDTHLGPLAIIPVDALNTWQSHNKDTYKANIISDMMVAGISNGGAGMQNNAYQNVYADLYAVDTDEGLPWFGYGGHDSDWTLSLGRRSITFTNHSLYTNHRCQQNSGARLQGGEFSMRTSEAPLVAGYIGSHDVDTGGILPSYYGVRNGDAVPFDETAMAFFIHDVWTNLGSGEGNADGYGCKWSAGDVEHPGKSDTPPYGQWIWPDLETDYFYTTHEQEWVFDTDMRPGYNADVEGYGRGHQKNHSNSSGYSVYMIVTNGRRSEDESWGVKPRAFEGYYRHHNYTSLGDYMQLMSYVNKHQLKKFYEDSKYSKYYYYHIWEERINANGESNAMYESVHKWLDQWAGSYYGTPLVLPDIDIKNDAENGYYATPFKVKNYYIPIIYVDTPSIMDGRENKCDTAINGGEKWSLECKYMPASSGNYPNGVVIHDPISVEGSQVIGVNYGSWANGIPDVTGDDQRIYQDSSGNWYEITDESQKANYAVVGDPFHVWISTFGDFYDGSGEMMSNITSPTTSRGTGGAVQVSGMGSGQGGEGMSINTSNPGDGSRMQYSDPASSAASRGYQNSMNTETWIWEHLVSFNFPVTYTDKNGRNVAVGANSAINLDDVLAWCPDGSGYSQSGSITKREIAGTKVNDSGYEGNNPWHYDSALNGVFGNDETFNYGLDFSFVVLPSAYETRNGEVTVYARAINARDNQEIVKTNNEKNDLRPGAEKNYAADDLVSKTMPIEIVGRIGNLALMDVGDFRFSELFKEATTDWLITGVIHKTDAKKPKSIMSVKDDIWGSDVTVGNESNRLSHSTLSVTHYLIGAGSGANRFGGKAALYEGNKSSYSNKVQTTWRELPLTAAYNPVKEYQTEQLRMGYDAYFDIETVGNYYGYNFKTGSSSSPETKNEIDRGPLTAADEDKRENVMTIIPKYFLYDYSIGGNSYGTDRTDAWIPVALYYGSGGSRQLFYNDGEIIEGRESSNLYIDLGNGKESERDRRVTTRAEVLLTKMVTSKLKTDTGDTSMSHSALDGKDFIGTSAKIVLDQFDRNFIGSNVFYGEVITNDDVNMGSGNGDGMFWNLADFTGNTLYWRNNQSDIFEGLQDTRFANQSQRWYFTLGLPSSTYVTYPVGDYDMSDMRGGSTGTTVNQLDIEKSHQKLMQEHPHSVLVAFLDIKVHGDVWTLQYDASNMNENKPFEFDIFNKDNLPKDWDSGWKLRVVLDPKNPPRDDKDPKIGIDPKWQIVTVYDKELTSASDWSTSGTH